MNIDQGDTALLGLVNAVLATGGIVHIKHIVPIGGMDEGAFIVSAFRYNLNTPCLFDCRIDYGDMDAEWEVTEK